MKKILSILAAASIVSTAGATVISCARKNGAVDQASGNSKLNDYYKTIYNYQTGPEKSAQNLNNNYHDEFVTSFNGSSKSTFSVYNTDKDIYKPYFYGDKGQLSKTSDQNFKQVGWLNDDISFQNILVFHKDTTKYSNIRIDVTDETLGIKDSQKLKGKASFEKYMLTQRHNSNVIDDTIIDGRQYMPDALEGNELNSLAQSVSDDGGLTSKDVYFDVQVAWISLESSLNTYVGNHKMNLKITFDYENAWKKTTDTINKKASVEIKNIVLNKDDYDENEDGKVDYSDRFGMSASTFPVNGMARWDNNIYGKVPNTDVVITSNDLDSNGKLNLDVEDNGATYQSGYVSGGVNLKIDHNIKENKISITPNRTDLPFIALIKAIKDGEIISTYSVYFNKAKPIPAVRNLKPGDKATYGSAILNDPTEALVNDINGDGIKDAKDWDIDGDGKYTREDWNASDNEQKQSDGSYAYVPDEIGPSPNYADFVKRTAFSWDELNQEYAPLKQLNSSLISGTGTHKQLIQYIGRLNAKGKNPQFNENESGPADDYESMLLNANKSANAFSDFITSTPGHEWTWTFDFSNLDMYVRLAAKNNIPSVYVNPVDVGGFSFWYLKGPDAKLGPQRDMLGGKNMGIIDPNNGKLSVSGRAYVNNVISKLSKSLSKHIAEDINVGNEYKLSDGKTPVRIYFSFDEDNEEAIEDTMKVVNKNSVKGGKIYSSCFLGWRSDVSHSSFDSQTWKNDFENEYFDQIVFVYRLLRYNASNSDLPNIRNEIMSRRERGQTTMFYTTADAKPGGYLQTDLSDDYWQLLMAYRLGLNGYVRWGYDNVMHDYFNDSTIHAYADLNAKSRVSGQDFLIYGGQDDSGVRYSVRLMAYINALNYVYKIRQILHSNGISKNEVGKALSSIGKTSITFSNNDWKYNINSAVSINDFQMPSDDNPVSDSEQVYKIISLIDSYDYIDN